MSSIATAALPEVCTVHYVAPEVLKKSQRLRMVYPNSFLKSNSGLKDLFFRQIRPLHPWAAFRSLRNGAIHRESGCVVGWCWGPRNIKDPCILWQDCTCEIFEGKAELKLYWHLDEISSWSHFFASCPEHLDSTWGTQVVLFVMLAGVPPFHDDDDLELMKKVKKGPRPERVETMAHPLVFSIDCQGRAETKAWKFPVKLGKSLFFFSSFLKFQKWIHTAIKVWWQRQMTTGYTLLLPFAAVIGRYSKEVVLHTRKGLEQSIRTGQRAWTPEKNGKQGGVEVSNFGWFESFESLLPVCIYIPVLWICHWYNQ